jgi:ABC-type bacteriocin/lantibiotic exporter with double-glycine peptidase domain
MAAKDKLGHIFDLETESTSGEEVFAAEKRAGMRVEVGDLGFGYGPGQTLFSGKNFVISAGSSVALYGPQGSGVSSLLDLLFAVRQPTEGYLSFDGMDSRNCQLERLRESIQLLRRDEFIDGTIVENIRLGRPDVGMDEIRKALSQAGLLEDVLRHPDGLDRRLRIGGAPFATSQRICLLFARAVVQEPRLLLIDELFDGLDEETFGRLSSVVFKAGFPWTVIVATRMQEVIQICDRKIELTPADSQQKEAVTNQTD